LPHLYVSSLLGLCARWAHSPTSLFFFQAKDGIRDRNVTGVQTCALPILIHIVERQQRPYAVSTNGSLVMIITVTDNQVTMLNTRSEERRVGKECRDRWARKPEIRWRIVEAEKTMSRRSRVWSVIGCEYGP